MIRRFLLFDLYGYLVPGLVFLGLFSLPRNLAPGEWPPGGWSSWILLLVFSYVAGHLLQILARGAFPARFRVASGEARDPSDQLLDRQDATLSHEMKERVADHVGDWFGIDVRAEDRQRSERRGDAFVLCHNALVQQDASPSANHFQGMSALMRGLLGAVVLGASWFLGWALQGTVEASVFSTVLWCVGVGLVVLACVRWLHGRRWSWMPAFVSRIAGWSDPWWFWLAALVLVCCGGLFAITPLGWESPAVPWAMFGSLLVLAHLVGGAYRRFSETFTACIYHDFVALAETETDSAAPAAKAAGSSGGRASVGRSTRRRATRKASKKS